MTLRRCDGSDKSLIARDGSGNCSCGLSFDDAAQSVFWPHNMLREPLAPAQMRVLAEALGRQEAGRATGAPRPSSAATTDPT